MNLFTNALLFDPQNVSYLSLLVGAMAWMVLFLVLVVDVFTSPSNSGVSKFAWLLILIVLPILGGSIYAILSMVGAVRRRVAIGRA